MPDYNDPAERYRDDRFADTTLFSAQYGHEIGSYHDGCIYDPDGSDVGMCTSMVVVNRDGLRVGYCLHHRLVDDQGNILAYWQDGQIVDKSRTTVLFTWQGDSRAAAAIAILTLVACTDALRNII